MQAINLSIANASHSLDQHIGLIHDAFERGAASARELIGAEGIDVIFVDAPDEAIPEWGVGGYTWGPHVILVALDPAFDLVADKVETTLVHELHHAMRWRGPGCGGSLAQMLVSEGLAVLFEEEVLGKAPFYSQVPITDREVTQARAALFVEPFSQSKWFFGADGITFGFGYTYGYQLCKAYAQAAGKRASELVDVPTRDVIGFDSDGAT